MALALGGVHRGAAPVGTAAPWIVIEHQAGSDSTTMNGVRVLVSSLFQVKAVGPASITQNVADVAAQADDLLFLNTVTAVTGGYIHSCVREQPLMYDEQPAAGIKYTHIGGLYRAIIEKV
jgi:hypothetical protein